MNKTINNDIIELPIGKIFISRQQGDKQFFKVTSENIITDLNKEEREYISNIFISNKRDVMYFEDYIDEKYKDVFEDNPDIANLRGFMKPPLIGVGKIIPHSAKENYYSKLYSVSFVEKELEGNVTGSYSPESNTITLSKKYLEAAKEMEKRGMIKSANLAYVNSETHELIHLASTKHHSTGEITSRI